MTFVDTSFLFAGFAPGDVNHRTALDLIGCLANRRLVTTNHVLGELWSLTRRRESHAAAVQVVDRITSPSSTIAVAHVTPELEVDAFDWLRRRYEREYSFVDATSFAFMRREGITDVLAFDHDFAAAGFTELRP